jgi:L-fuconolactonase
VARRRETDAAVPAIVDSHQHFWDISRFAYPWMPPGPGVLRRNYLPEDLLPETRSAGVSRTVVVQALDDEEETRFLLDLAERHSWIAGVVGWVDLEDPSVAASLGRAAANRKLVGVRHQVEAEPDDRWLLRPSTLRGLRELASRGLPFDLVVYPRHLGAVPGVAAAVPDLRMVLDHVGKPPIASGGTQPWMDDISRIGQLPGVFCKVSGLVTEADRSRLTAEALRPYVDHVMKAFGHQRIMWGSDWPVCLKAASYRDVRRLGQELLGDLAGPDAAAFWGDAARGFYRLE